MTGTLYCQKAPSFGWDVKPRSWLFVVIKNPRMSFEKSRGVTSASWPNLPIGLWPSWPPNHPHILIGFIHSVSSPPVAGVWWAFWHTMAAVTSSRWMLHTGGGRGDTPSQCRALWVLRKAEKRYINVMNYYYYYTYWKILLNFSMCSL